MSARLDTTPLLQASAESQEEQTIEVVEFSNMDIGASMQAFAPALIDISSTESQEELTGEARGLSFMHTGAAMRASAPATTDIPSTASAGAVEGSGVRLGVGAPVAPATSSTQRDISSVPRAVNNNQAEATNVGEEGEDRLTLLGALSLALGTSTNSLNTGTMQANAAPMGILGQFTMDSLLRRYNAYLGQEAARHELASRSTPTLVHVVTHHNRTPFSLNPFLRSAQPRGQRTQIKWNMSQPAATATISFTRKNNWRYTPATNPDSSDMTLRIEGVESPIIVRPGIPGNSAVVVLDILEAVEEATVPEGIRRHHRGGARWGGLYKSLDEPDVWVVVIHGW